MRLHPKNSYVVGVRQASWLTTGTWITSLTKNRNDEPQTDEGEE